MYGYIYLTTNLVNKKIYVGQKKSEIFLGNKYLGSGFMLARAIKKYGRNNFNVELLEFCESKLELNEREVFYIAYYNSTNSDIGYNIATGGQGGDLGPEVNKRISKAVTGIPCSEEKKEKLRIANTGKKASLETRRKQSQKQKGRKRSDETKRKMSESAKKLDRSNRVNPTKGKISITDGIDVKYIDPKSEIPEGWYLGNCHTKGKHDMSHYTEEMREHRRELSRGSNNTMYGKGYKIAGGKNGKATHIYTYKGVDYQCRKDLHKALLAEGYTFGINTLRSIVLNPNSIRLNKKYGELIHAISMRLKSDEDKIN